jgi:hypothetical protein
MATTQPPAVRPAAQSVRAIAKEAYIYGFPMVDNYRIQHSYFVDRGNPEYKGPWNQVHNTARVFTPNDKVVQTPNSDTPYSAVGADLRAEPLVFTFPIVEKGRYYSAQFIDAYTFNFAYVGSRATGNDGGSFLLAGPKWQGETPPGVKGVIRSETELAFVVYRTQLFGPDDIDKVKQIQAGYSVQTLSRFLDRPAPPAAPKIDFINPITADEERHSLEFFRILNFVLQFCRTDPSETALMARFSEIGIGVEGSFDPQSLSAETSQAFEDGMADAWKDYQALEKRLDAGEITSAAVFGSRAYLKNNYSYRMLAAVDGIYGNSKEEAYYPMYMVDSAGDVLDGSKGRYVLHFASDKLPPVNAFWSLTMYALPSRLLVANSLNRYLINSPMLPKLERDGSGGLTLYIQNATPGADRQANWLPAPSGPFMMALRLYWPKPDAFNGAWTQPALHRVD